MRLTETFIIPFAYQEEKLLKYLLLPFAPGWDWHLVLWSWTDQRHRRLPPFLFVLINISSVFISLIHMTNDKTQKGSLENFSFRTLGRSRVNNLTWNCSLTYLHWKNCSHQEQREREQWMLPGSHTVLQAGEEVNVYGSPVVFAQEEICQENFDNVRLITHQIENWPSWARQQVGRQFGVHNSRGTCQQWEGEDPSSCKKVAGLEKCQEFQHSLKFIQSTLELFLVKWQETLHWWAFG